MYLVVLYDHKIMIGAVIVVYKDRLVNDNIQLNVHRINTMLFRSYLPSTELGIFAYMHPTRLTEESTVEWICYNGLQFS